MTTAPRTLRLRWSVSLPLLGLLCLSTGCSMFKLGKDLDVLYEGLTILSGEVELLTQGGPPDTQFGSPLSGPVVVLLIREDSMPALIDYRLADGKNRFNFQAPAGQYTLAAFVDQNGDFIYQPGEATGRISGPAASNRLDTQRADWRFNRIQIDSDSAPFPPLPVAADLSSTGLRSLERTATTMGVLLDYSSDRFTPEAVSLGMWEPTRWILEVNYGFYLEEPWNPKEKKPLLLLVHGINGSPRDFKDLLEGLDTSAYRVALFHYPSGLRMEDNAYMLTQTLNELSVRSPGQHITLLGHSMGGLIAKRFIDQHTRGNQQSTIDRFISISTPWLGHGSAGAGVEYAPVVAPAWEDLAPGSRFLRRLEAFEIPESIDYALLFSHGGNSILMPDGNDGVVSLDSQLAPAMQDRANTFVGVSQDHAGILEAPRTLETIQELLSAPANSTGH